ncbi:MAG TPA: hypothetical protein VJA16_18205 [Thermoanaerobaculia bacterium]
MSDARPPIVLIGSTIEQLRQYCPAFEGRVAGAADFALGLKEYNATMRLPAAYVLPLEQASDGHQNMIGARQMLTRTVGVVVEFDARPDRRGQAPTMLYDETQAELCKAILNWQPAAADGGPGTGRVPNHQGYWLSGGRMLDLDRARLFYQWEFSVEWQLDDADAWEWPAEDITEIELDIHLQPLSRHPDPAVRMRIGNLQPPIVWDDPRSPTYWDNGRTIWVE